MEKVYELANSSEDSDTQEESQSQGNQELDSDPQKNLPVTEETSNNADIMENTQAVLEFIPKQVAATKKKIASKGKGVGKGQASIQKQKKMIIVHPFFIWLKNYWDSESTMVLMPQFLLAIKTESLQNGDANLARLIRPINLIMKTFVTFIVKQKLPLKRIGWDIFEAWVFEQGLSTMFGNCQDIKWMDHFDALLFRLYGTVYTQNMTGEAKIMSDSENEDQEENQKGHHGDSSLLANTTTTSMLSTTARTVEDPADAGECAISPNLSLQKKKTRFLKNGIISKGASISKLKTTTINSKLGSVKRRKSVESSNEESEPEIVVKRKRKMTTTDTEQDSEDSDALEDLLDGVVQAQCLRPSFGSISQSICLKHQDSLIMLKSPGERGTRVVKFDIYPYSDCLRKPKNEWWKTAILRSQFLQYSEGSRVATLVDKLSKEIFKQIRAVKKVEIETKSVAFKSG